MPRISKTAASEEISDAPILIKAYGEFWNPELVNWERTWRLLGTDRSGRKINVYEQRGIYVLYQDYEPMYVGRADRQSIGYRLQLHRESRRKGPRWDRFSWFGLTTINKSGGLRKLNSHAHSRTSELAATLEALLIIAVSPRLNARREKFKNAVHIFQSDEDLPMSKAEQRLASIEEKLESLLSTVER